VTCPKSLCHCHHPYPCPAFRRDVLMGSMEFVTVSLGRDAGSFGRRCLHRWASPRAAAGCPATGEARLPQCCRWSTGCPLGWRRQCGRRAGQSRPIKRYPLASRRRMAASRESCWPLRLFNVRRGKARCIPGGGGPCLYRGSFVEWLQGTACLGKAITQQQAASSRPPSRQYRPKVSYRVSSRLMGGVMARWRVLRRAAGGQLAGGESRHRVGDRV
jgi:hypothetical protein